MKVITEIGSSVEYPSVFWIFSTTDCDFNVFFCFLWWRLLLLIEYVSESEVLLNAIVRFSLRKIGVIYLADGVDCSADGLVVSGWVGGAAIGTSRLKCSICVKSGLFMNASSCRGLRFGICIFNARATLLELEIQERPEEITLTLSVCFRLRFTFLLPESFLIESFLWFTIFCSRVFSCTFSGCLSMYCPSSVSISFRVPNLAMFDFRTQNSGLFGTFITSVVGLFFTTVLLGARTS